MKSKGPAKSFNDLAVGSKPVPLKKALKIFDQLADMEDVAFGYPYNGCEARAYILCRRMTEMGLTPGKAWAFEGKRKLCVELAGKKYKWWFHVAPVLPIRMPDKTVQNLVIDPGLFDGPVSLKEWGDIMKTPPEKLQIVPLGVPPEGWSGDYNTRINSSSYEADKDAGTKMRTYLAWQNAPPRPVFPSRIRQQMPKAQGKTWVTMNTTDTKKSPKTKLKR
jgi:hypothetical protein